MLKWSSCLGSTKFTKSNQQLLGRSNDACLQAHTTQVSGSVSACVLVCRRATKRAEVMGSDGARSCCCGSANTFPLPSLDASTTAYVRQGKEWAPEGRQHWSNILTEAVIFGKNTFLKRRVCGGFGGDGSWRDCPKPLANYNPIYTSRLLCHRVPGTICWLLCERIGQTRAPPPQLSQIFERSQRKCNNKIGTRGKLSNRSVKENGGFHSGYFQRAVILGLMSSATLPPPSHRFTSLLREEGAQTGRLWIELMRLHGSGGGWGKSGLRIHFPRPISLYPLFFSSFQLQRWKKNFQQVFLKDADSLW